MCERRFCKKIFGAGRDSAGGALAVLRKHSTEGRTPDAVDPQIKTKISLHLRARRTRSVRRLIRRPARSPRPASIDRSLERPAKHEKDQHEHNADHDDLPLRNRASRAHASGHPHAGRRGEPVHVMTFLASDDNAPRRETRRPSRCPGSHGSLRCRSPRGSTERPRPSRGTRGRACAPPSTCRADHG